MRRPHLFYRGAGLVGLEGADPLKAVLGAEAAVEIILQGLEEGVGREKLLHSQAVSQVGERQRDFEVGGNFLEDFQLLDLGLAHLRFHLEQEFPQAQQIIIPFAVFPDFVPQKVELLLSGQGAVGDDFAHRRGPFSAWKSS